MIVSSVNSTAMPVFKARLACTHNEMKNFLKHKSDEDTISLVYKITDAFEKHPSNAVLRPSIQSKPGIYGTRGVISSRFATYTDVEPVENNSINPIKNIIRRMLDPENKNCLMNLLGTTNTEKHDSWWNENIAPIWNEINKSFRSKSFFKSNHDKEFNQDFQNRKEKTWYNLINEQA